MTKEKALVIVESPAKSKTIKKILGKDEFTKLSTVRFAPKQVKLKLAGLRF